MQADSILGMFCKPPGQLWVFIEYVNRFSNDLARILAVATIT